MATLSAEHHVEMQPPAESSVAEHKADANEDELDLASQLRSINSSLTVLASKIAQQDAIAPRPSQRPSQAAAEKSLPVGGDRDLLGDPTTQPSTPDDDSDTDLCGPRGFCAKLCPSLAGLMQSAAPNVGFILLLCCECAMPALDSRPHSFQTT